MLIMITVVFLGEPLVVGLYAETRSALYTLQRVNGEIRQING